MNHTLYPVILLPVTVLVLAGATCMGYIYSNEKLLQLQLQLVGPKSDSGLAGARPRKQPPSLPITSVHSLKKSLFLLFSL